MQYKTHYAPVSEALEKLRQQGFTVDFNLKNNVISCSSGDFRAAEFEIMDVYRYEGNSDPADEATVYAIQSNTGVKGVLVTGYSAAADNVSPELLKKLH